MEWMRFDLAFMLRHLPDFGPAIVTALELLGWSFALAFGWGVVLAICRLRRGPLYWASTAYVELLRNTPLLVHIYFVFFGLPLLGLPLSAFASGVLAIVAQHGAFFAETFRGTIQSVPTAQREAGLALGMMPQHAMRFVVLPQAVRNAIPAIGNQLILILQDTALVSTIGVYEITRQGHTLAERSAASFEMFVAVGAIYLILSTFFSVVMRSLEHGYRIVK